MNRTERPQTNPQEASRWPFLQGKAIPAWLLSLFIVVQAGLSGFAGYVWMDAKTAGTLPPETRIGSLQVGGLSPETAERMSLDAPEMAGMPSVIYLDLLDASYPLDADSLGLSIEEQTLHERLLLYSSDSVWQRMLAGFAKRDGNAGMNVALPLRSDRPSLAVAARSLSSVWNREAVSAVVTLAGESLRVVPDVRGRRLEEEVLVQWLTDRLLEGRPVSNAAMRVNPGQDNVKFYQEMEPVWTAGLFTGMRRMGSADLLMAEGGASDAAAAASALSGWLLQPGEDFSLQEQMQGFKGFPATEDAPSRVATALFRALLPLEGMTVLERHAAPYATNFAPPGQEAMVGKPAGDLAMRNGNDFPVLVMAQSEGESLRILSFSQSSIASATVFSDVTETYEPPLIQSLTRELDPGEVRVIAAGRAGMKVEVYRVGDAGKKLLHTDQYPPQNRILEVGMQADPRLTVK